MRIQHNIMAMSAYRNYNTNTSALAKNLEKLSSGYKINRAGDDAAGLAISEKMRAQITGLNAAQKNVKDGISLVKTAEGAMQEIQDMLNRMDYLATQSANGTYDNEVDRYNLQKEVDQLKSEINRIADSANFNGIKLLDGSLDSERASAAASPISEVTVNDYAPAGAADAFEYKYIQNRPAASAAQTNASFTVKLDDKAVSGLTVGDTIELTIGGDRISYTVTAGDTITSAADLVTKLKTSGKAATATSVAASPDGATSNSTTGGVKTDTAAWDSGTTVSTTLADNKYIKIEGHWYEMGTSGNDELTFTQVDYMGEGGEIVTPDYSVSLRVNGKDAAFSDTGDVNWQVQHPTSGYGKGSTHQAQVEVKLDFSKLKNGDKLVAGNKTYVFKTDSQSTLTTAAGEVLVDLTSILKTPEDFEDADKLAQALNKVVDTIGTGSATTWSAGDGGVNGSVGTITFQSLSSYADKTTGATIGGGANGELCDMSTEAKVMAQFSGKSAATDASVSFKLDASKLKEGDTVTIDGVTFEFTNGSNVSSKGNVAVNLASLGISDKAGSLASYQVADVVDALKTAINTELPNRYNVTLDGDKVTLTSKDISGTTAKENEVAAKIELAPGATNGSGLVLQIGDTGDSFNQLEVNVKDMHTAALGIADLDISSPEGAKAAIQTIKDAINSVSSTRGTLGATQNRLEHTANNLSVMAENIQDAESTIRDTDIAEEMMAYTKNNILIQSAQAMLAQANAVPQGVLQLLG